MPPTFTADSGGAAAAGGMVTWMAMSVTQEAPLLPQDLTCRTWAPVEDVTCAEIDLATTMVVFQLLSIEYPIAATG